MRKIFVIIVLFSTIALSQTYYGVNDAPVLNKTVKWVTISTSVHIHLGEGIAIWSVDFYDENLNYIIGDRAEFNYSGQPVTLAAQKTVTANLFGLIYNGLEK